MSRTIKDNPFFRIRKRISKPGYVMDEVKYSKKNRKKNNEEIEEQLEEIDGKD